MADGDGAVQQLVEYVCVCSTTVLATIMVALVLLDCTNAK